MNEELKEQLINLYNHKSKHSNYQILASNFDDIIDNSEINVVTRYEKERLAYILSKINVTDKSVLDIGGNTGFFTFEVLNAGAKCVDYYEGNEDHSEFVELASSIISLENKINVHKQYFQFSTDKITSKYDITFLLNVLHHIGDDYGNPSQNKIKAKENIIAELNFMASYTDILIFQLGFNWKGNRNICLFENGTKKEMIDFIQTGTQGYWNIIDIGIAEKDTSGIIYHDLSDSNIERNDALGEFLNRPIFIMKSLKA